MFTRVKRTSLLRQNIHYSSKKNSCAGSGKFTAKLDSIQAQVPLKVIKHLFQEKVFKGGHDTQHNDTQYNDT